MLTGRDRGLGRISSFSMLPMGPQWGHAYPFDELTSPAWEYVGMSCLALHIVMFLWPIHLVIVVGIFVFG